MTLSVVLITYNEESNLARTLESVRPLLHDRQGEIIVVDSGSTDRTVEIAKSFGAKVFVEAWKGYAGQKNSAIEKASGDWILSLDADEEVDSKFCRVVSRLASKPDGLTQTDLTTLAPTSGGDSSDRVEVVTAYEEAVDPGKEEPPDSALAPSGYRIARKNEFLGRWIKHGGFWPDPKLRLFRRGCGRFEERAVHETVKVSGHTATLKHGAILHRSYPTLSDYIDHMNRYSSLGAEMIATEGPTGFGAINIVIRPWLTFVYNYFLRLGFLDGREGLLLHAYHAVYVSWKYAKAWELRHSRKP
ncbi:MAG TPA: glycosyltransferase family 2 protein [Terriglobales bacterium]|nr:glycosyltransferase family 2 protein [Terriglobales bacterium]